MSEEKPNGQDAEGSYIAQARDGSTATITVVPKDRSPLVIAFFALVAILALIAGLVVAVVLTRDQRMLGETAVIGTATPTPTFHSTASSKRPNDTPTPTATLHPTAVTPTATATNTPEPSPTSTPSCPTVGGPFGTVWNIVQGELGCATRNAITGLIAEENFERGKMFWREPIDEAQALVLFDNKTWRVFQHAPFVEGSPDFSCPDTNTPSQCPPTPKRGFGMMWCDILEIRSGLGNAIDCEHSYQGAMQDFERGFMLQTDSGVNYVFYSDGRWELR